jgi:hypothetical protein
MYVSVYIQYMVYNCVYYYDMAPTLGARQERTRRLRVSHRGTRPPPISPSLFCACTE